MTRNWGLSRSQQQHGGNCEQQDCGGNNFGIVEHRALSNETSRKAVGENQPSGSLCGADTTRPANVIQLASRLPPGTARLNSRSKEVEPFIHPFEFGSYCLLVAVALLPCLFVCAAVFFYALFVA